MPHPYSCLAPPPELLGECWLGDQLLPHGNVTSHYWDGVSTKTNRTQKYNKIINIRVYENSEMSVVEGNGRVGKSCLFYQAFTLIPCACCRWVGQQYLKQE